jgi:hypothetical protein
LLCIFAFFFFVCKNGEGNVCMLPCCHVAMLPCSHVAMLPKEEKKRKKKKKKKRV